LIAALRLGHDLAAEDIVNFKDAGTLREARKLAAELEGLAPWTTPIIFRRINIVKTGKFAGDYNVEQIEDDGQDAPR